MAEGLLTRENQPATRVFAEPVVYASKDSNGNTQIRVVDKATGDDIRFGGCVSATWAFGLVTVENAKGEPEQRTRLCLILDNPTVVQE